VRAYLKIRASKQLAFACLTCLALVWVLEAAEPGPASPPGVSAAARMSVSDVKGALHRPLSDDGQKATVLFFVLHDCPISNSYAPEINRIVEAYGNRDVRCYIVYVESDLSARAARRHVKDFKFKCPALLDPSHLLVNYTKATVTPEAAVLSAKGVLLYRGRIDDRVTDFGKSRVEPTRRDLRQALDAILEGKPVPTPFTKAVGCYISTVEEERQAHEN